MSDFDGLSTYFVGCTNNGTLFDSAASHQHGHSIRIVTSTKRIDAAAFVVVRRAAKFAGPNHERVVEHAAVLEVLDQRGHRLVHRPYARAVAALEIIVTIPAAHDVLANAEVAEVRMVTLEIAPTRLVRNRSDVHAAVALAGKAVAELHFQIGHGLVRRIGEIAPALIAVAHDHAVGHRPRWRGFGRSRLPTLERFAIEHGNEAVLVRGCRDSPSQRAQRQADNDFPDFHYTCVSSTIQTAHCDLSNQFLNHFAAKLTELFVAAGVEVGEFVVIQAK